MMISKLDCRYWLFLCFAFSFARTNAQSDSLSYEHDFLHHSYLILGVSGGSYSMNSQPEANEWLRNQHEPLLSPTQPVFGIYLGGMVNRFGGLIGFESNAHGNYAGLDFQSFKMAARYKLYAGKEIEIHTQFAVDVYWSDIQFDKQPQRLLYFNYPHDAYLEQVNAGFLPSITLLHPISRTHPVFKYIYVGAEVGYRQMVSYGVWRYGYNADTQDNSYYHSFPIGSFIGNSMVSGFFANIHIGCSIGEELLAED